MPDITRDHETALQRQPAVGLLGLQHAPRSLQHKRRASLTAGILRRSQEVSKGMAARPRIAATQPTMIDAITMALSNPTIFDFVPVFELQASSSMLSLAAHGYPLIAHLWIFPSGGLEGAHA
ncbi:hypothetical protein H4582DRAFT_2083495 [Lactarius indigo]|nr:hypothetical protein H4582DRAFT_2083495 [Lactarius indigo]